MVPDSNTYLFYTNNPNVLILLILEDGPWRRHELSHAYINGGLNPTYSGRWSLTRRVCFYPQVFVFVLILLILEDGPWLNDAIPETFKKDGLNPTYSGRWSLTLWRNFRPCRRGLVLILLILEDGPWHWLKKHPSRRMPPVLILLILEDGPWP